MYYYIVSNNLAYVYVNDVIVMYSKENTIRGKILKRKNIGKWLNIPNKFSLSMLNAAWRWFVNLLPSKVW